MTLIRKAAVIAAALFAVVASRFHEITGLGVPIAEYAAANDTTLRAAGYAFAIWGLLYLGMLAYAVFHATPAGDRSSLVRRTAWPAAIAFASCGAWVIAACLQLYALTLALILLGAVTLTSRLAGLAGCDARAAEKVDEWLGLWPLAALAGWMTVASGLNTVAVAEHYGLLTNIPAPLVAAAVVVVVTGSSLFVGSRIRSLSFPLAIAWGFAAIAVAERAERPAITAVAALGGLVCILGGLILRRRPLAIVP
jgi:hypothetical protein